LSTDVVNDIVQLPEKGSAADPIPTDRSYGCTIHRCIIQSFYGVQLIYGWFHESIRHAYFEETGTQLIWAQTDPPSTTFPNFAPRVQHT
jgi:hypothetical protein